MADEHVTEEDLFLQALAIESAAERAAYLETIDRENPARARRIRELLELHEQPRGPLDRSPVMEAEPLTTSAAEPPAEIGPYQLREKLGEGGMGSVWLAEQQQPVKRQVALKIIHPGMNSQAVLARFEAERHALERMDHPHIARILDAGATPDGRPYFVIELVRGSTFTQYCDDRQLDVRQRLQLFGNVCRAVHHAHQKGIIHRDIKPSNVLITELDGRPVVKVIDFGIAKAIRDPLSDKTTFTQHGQVIGTLEYMSPEQADFQHRDVDTRSDIYSLGVLLYELLTGTTPFERQQLRQAAFDEMLRVIREVEPPRPSDKLSTSDTLSAIASRRAIEPARLSRTVRGDLDWVVMKALEKDRDRRYTSAIDFANDIERFLSDQPVQAGPPSRLYRLRKFAKRNRSVVLASSFIALALIAGTVAATWGMVLARRAEHKAVDLAQKNKDLASQELAARQDADRKRQDAERARQKEVEERQHATAVADLMVQILRSPDMEREGKSITIAEVLDRAVEDLKNKSTTPPRIRARVLRNIGETLTGLGLYKEAADAFQHSRTIGNDHFGADDPDTLGAQGGLGRAMHLLGQRQQAIALFEDLLPRQEKVLGKSHQDTLHTINGLGIAFGELGDYQRAIPLLRENLKNYQTSAGVKHELTLMAMNSLGTALEQTGQFSEAIPLFQQAWELQKETLGVDHPHALASMHNLAATMRRAGRRDEALATLKECVRLREGRLGADHPATLRAKDQLGSLLTELNEYAAAIELLEVAHRGFREQLGSGHTQTLNAANSLAVAYAKAGRMDDAQSIFDDVLAVRRANANEQPKEFVLALINSGNFAFRAGKYQKYLELSKEAQQFAEQNLGASHPWTLEATKSVAMAYTQNGDVVSALPMLERVLAERRKLFGDEHRNTLISATDLAIALDKDRQFERALEILESTFNTAKSKYGENDETTVNTMYNLAFVSMHAGNGAQAIELGTKVLETREKSLGSSNPTTLLALNALASYHRDCGDPARALELFNRCLQHQSNSLGQAHPLTIATMAQIAGIYRRTHRDEEALGLIERVVEARRKQLGEDHPETLSALSAQAASLERIGKPVEAIALHEYVLQRNEASLGSDHPATTNARNALGLAWLSTNELDKAEQLARQALDIATRAHPDHWQAFDTRVVLGRILLAKGQADQGKAMVQEGLAGLEIRRPVMVGDELTRIDVAKEVLQEIAPAGEDQGQK